MASITPSRRTITKLEKNRDDLLKQVNSLKDQLAEAAEAEPSKVMTALNQAYDKLHDQVSGFLESDFAQRHGLDDAWETSKDKVARVQSEIEDRPVQSAAIAMAIGLGVGALTGMLLRRN